jgi:hypothetical protein
MKIILLLVAVATIANIGLSAFNAVNNLIHPTTVIPTKEAVSAAATYLTTAQRKTLEKQEQRLGKPSSIDACKGGGIIVWWDKNDGEIPNSSRIDMDGFVDFCGGISSNPVTRAIKSADSKPLLFSTY